MKRGALSATILCLAALAALGQTNYPYVITTVAGTYPLGDGGPATAALLLGPYATVVDAAGNLYIADTDNRRLRKVGRDGVITTVAGFENWYCRALAIDAAGSIYLSDGYFVRKLAPSGAMTTVVGSGYYGFEGDGGPATAARFRSITALAVDHAGNIYIADSNNYRIRRVDPSGVITTIAGTGTQGYAGDSGPATAARLNYPNGLVVDGAGNLYIADSWNRRVRKVDSAGQITTIAGNGSFGSTGDGGLATAASISSPAGLAMDSAGNLYVAESEGHRVRKVSSAGIITTVAGKGQWGFSGDGGLATAAEFANPRGVTVDLAGNLYVSDTVNNRVRKVTPDGIISTAAGATHFAGDGGPATSALLQYPNDVALDAAGNLYIADQVNYRIRKVTPAGVISTVAGNGTSTSSGDGGSAVSTGVFPGYLATDKAGNLYVSEGYRVRKVSPSGVITTVAGTGESGYSGDGGPATAARLYAANGIAMDAAGNLYIADTQNYRLRKVSPDGVITTIAGNGTSGYSGDGGLATAAQVRYVLGVVVDSSGNVYLADQGNLRIRKVTPAGIISTVAGNGECCSGGDGGPATSARIIPTDLTIDSAGNLYIASSSSVRKIGADGIIRTIAGTGLAGFSGDGGIATSAGLYAPTGLAVDSSGSVYVADRYNHRVRKLTLNAPAAIRIVSGDGQRGPVGSALPNALIVSVVGPFGTGVPEVRVTFAVTSGAATLSTTSTTTDASGRAGVALTLGNTPGAVAVTVTVTGLPPVRFNLTAAEATGPRVSAGGVAGVGGSVPPVKQISPNGLVSIYGENFAPAGTARAVGADDLVGGRVPTRLAGVCVEVGGQRAPVLAVYPHQINIQVPTLGVPGEAAVQVILKCGETGEERSNAEKAALQAASPEFLYFVRNLDGKNPIAATNAVTGELIGVANLIPGATFVPAKPGDVLTLYATGFGVTSPAYQAGELAGGIAPVVEAVKVTVGGVELAAGEILYAGVTPGLAGVYQLNLRLPGDLPDGDLPVVVRVGAISSPPGGYITVRR